MTTIDPNRLIQLRSTIIGQNDALKRASGSLKTEAPATVGTPSFAHAMSDAIRSVNTQQFEASAASAAYEQGETTDLVGVMLARQKASIGFEATLQVRNKLLSAYRDIMNMPV